jgi:hypothetical protein
VRNVVAVVSAGLTRTGQSRNDPVDQFAAMRDMDYEAPFGLSNVTPTPFSPQATSPSFSVRSSS